jgi:hypothetical protein
MRLAKTAWESPSLLPHASNLGVYPSHFHPKFAVSVDPCPSGDNPVTKRADARAGGA